MPDRAPHACPGCQRATTARGRCPRCRSARNRAIDARRGTAWARGYDGAWALARATVLAEEPLCGLCSTDARPVPSEVVDHVVPIAEAPHLRLVRSNLRGLCKACHDRRTMTEQVPRRNT